MAEPNRPPSSLSLSLDNNTYNITMRQTLLLPRALSIEPSDPNNGPNDTHNPNHSPGPPNPTHPNGHSQHPQSCTLHPQFSHSTPPILACNPQCTLYPQCTTYPQCTLYPQFTFYPQFGTNWGCNQAPQFYSMLPIWSSWGYQPGLGV